MISFQDVLQTQKLEKVKEITGAGIKEEEEPEGEALVGPEGDALRPPGIVMVYSPTNFLTFYKYLGNSQLTGFFCIKEPSWSLGKLV